MLAWAALPRCAPHAPIWPASISVCAAVIALRPRSFLASPSASASTAFSTFIMLSPPQPVIFAADAGAIANTTAAIAAAPSNFLLMLLFPFEQIQHHCRSLQDD